MQLQNYVNITAYDQQALKFAIAHMGPVSVAIDASHKSLSFYANGVYYDPACGKLNSIIHFTAGTIFCFSHLTDFSYFSLKKKKQRIAGHSQNRSKMVSDIFWPESSRLQ